MHRILQASGIALASLTACVELPPDHVVLLPQAESVELISDVPNEDVYEPYATVVSSASGRGTEEAVMNARNGLRNKAAALRATFVGVDETTAAVGWDFSGKTVVTMKGHVYRPKD